MQILPKTERLKKVFSSSSEVHHYTEFGSHSQSNNKRWQHMFLRIGVLTVIILLITFLVLRMDVHNMYRSYNVKTRYENLGKAQDPSLWFPDGFLNFNENSDTCSLVSKAERFDCHPDNNPNYDRCIQRGCCWDLSGTNDTLLKKQPPLGVPYCFYPRNYTIYKFGNIQRNQDTVNAKLNLVRNSGFPNDHEQLSFDAYLLDCNMLRIKIYSTDNKTWESPLPRIKKQFEKCSQRLYTLEILDGTSNFIIRRKNTSVPVFDTRSAPIISSDQFVQLSTNLPSKYIYGLGQHLDGLMLDVNWQRRVLWNVDQWNIPKSNLYGSHPFYMALEPSGAAHGVFVLNSNAMDVVLQPNPAATFHITGGIIDLFVVMGPTPDEVVQQYMEIIGKPFLPPYWSLGYHQCRYGCKTLQDTRKIFERTREAQIPFDVQWSDIDYMEDYNDFTINSVSYDGFPEFIDQVHENDMHYIVINDAAIGAGVQPGTYPPYDDGIKRGVFITNISGDPFIGKVWNVHTSVWPDFTNPNAVQYWTDWLQKFHNDIPYDGLWLDMNEPSNFWSGQKNGCPKSVLNDPPYLPPVTGGSLYYKTVCPSAQHAWGSHYYVHNLYGLTEMIATNKALRTIRKSERPFIISRSTFPGSGSVGGHWTGDVVSDWFNLKRSIADILTTGIHGIPMVGADICGFNGNTTVHLCNRWMQLGAFYPFSRNHNTDNGIDQDPVAMGPLVTESSKRALNIRYTLLPYLYSLLFRAHLTGKPVIKPLFSDYTFDSKTYDIDTQFKWGEALMIIPVLEENAIQVEGYFPRGRWFDWYTKTTLTDNGEVSLSLKAPLTTIPLSIKGGHIVPMQEPDITTTQSRKNPFGFLVALDNMQSANGFMYWDNGHTLDPYENNAYIKFNMTATKKNLLIKPNVLKWTPEEKMLLGWFEIWGLNESVTEVMVNNQKVEFSFNETAKSLVVKDLYIEMLSGPIEAKW